MNSEPITWASARIRASITRAANGDAYVQFDAISGANDEHFIFEDINFEILMEFFERRDDVVGLSNGQRSAASCNRKSLHKNLSKKSPPKQLWGPNIVDY